MTFELKISVGDIIATAGFIATAIGLFLAVYQLRSDAKRKRAEFIVSVFNQFITDSESTKIFYELEYGKFNYNSNFHGSEQERHLDRLLSYFEMIGTLYHMGVIHRSDLEIVRYHYLRVYNNHAIQEYFKFLDKLPVALGVSGGTYKKFREVACMLESSNSGKSIS